MNTGQTMYRFEHGIPGFEHIQQYTFEKLENDLPMMLMRAVGDEEVSLLVASPFLFYPEYEWELSASVKEELAIEGEADVEVWSVISVTQELANSTINLLAPLVINTRTGAGKQLILHDHAYSSKAPLYRK
ncbi:flagellar assembly protein FliW [Paenibacillus sp. J5C_2022]|uniref:flagellar assembly protein FliW n=1 Tax=Paenibacillus sp. J5C2022 TaxID=2977129 RepID=UPI0021CFD4DD|nr:flagellar assembly protein FliW [Paenibacillus sp. J5C2022]MCU6708441.1 flagellar assembly protein FliW [Paenibacillus sp. J5C2022]